MASDGPDVRTYQALAEGYDRQAQPQMRDRFLVLAAHAAFTSGQPAEADKLQSRLLKCNPHHLLRPYSSFAEAMNSLDVQNYIGALARSHPPERMLTLLASMKNDSQAIDRTPPLRTLHATEITPAEMRVYRLRTPVLLDESESGLPGAGSTSKKDSLPQIFGIRPDVPPQERQGAGARGQRSGVRSQGSGVKGQGVDDPSEPRKPLTPMVLAALILVTGFILAAYTLFRPFLR
jgi:hypothetical protein